MIDDAVEEVPSLGRILLIGSAFTVFVFAIFGSALYGNYLRDSRLADLVEIPVVPGEFVLNTTSKAVGQDASDAVAKYGNAHPDRLVNGTQLVVVIDDNGKARFYYKVFYKPR